MADVCVNGFVLRQIEISAPGCDCGLCHVTVWVAAEEDIDCWAVILVVDPTLDVEHELLDDEWADLAATVIVAYGVPWADLSDAVMQRQLSRVSLASTRLAFVLKEVPLAELRALRRLVRGPESAIDRALLLGQAYRERVQ